MKQGGVSQFPSSDVDFNREKRKQAEVRGDYLVYWLERGHFGLVLGQLNYLYEVE